MSEPVEATLTDQETLPCVHSRVPYGQGDKIVLTHECPTGRVTYCVMLSAAKHLGASRETLRFTRWLPTGHSVSEPVKATLADQETLHCVQGDKIVLTHSVPYGQGDILRHVARRAICD